MKKLIILTLSTFLSAGCSTSLIYFQPNIPYGGRATAISASPLDEKNIIVASETGGLFRSFNKGEKWWHVNTSNYLYTDVEHIFGTNVVLATSIRDSRTNSNGGIWRSTDKGETWKRVLVSFNCSNPPGAFCIFYESSSKVWAGTSCGVYTSNDDGQSWTHLNTPYDSKNIKSIQAFGNRIYLLVESVGLVTSNNGGATWTNISSGLAGIDNNGVHNAICMSYTSSDQLYWATKRQIDGALKTVLLYTANAGVLWQTIKEDNVWNRPPFVRLSRVSQTSGGDHFLYYGNGVKLFRNEVNASSTGNLTFSSWQSPTVEHSDPSDICFEVLDPKPLFLTTDGGLHRTKDYGNTWLLTGAALQGYNALQITEVAGSQHDGGRFDLYFATQDNSIWGSINSGSTWPNKICCEGFWLYTTHPYVAASKMHGVTCADCYNFQADPGLVNAGTFPNAPNQIGTPALLKPNFYVQNTRPQNMTSGNFFKLTRNNGNTWSSVFTFNDPILNTNTTVAGNPDNPVLFIPVSIGTIGGGDAFVLKRISNFMGDPQDVVIEHIDNFGELGTFPTMFAFYKVFGVNPANPNHFIVTDIVDSKMKVTIDGGETWTTNNTLTNLITNDGQLMFKRRGQTATGKERFVQCQVIAFNPLNTSNILIGTTQSGVIRSANGGMNWNYIKNTSSVTNISSFFFHTGGTIFSSYGRGLYKLKQNFGAAPTQKASSVIYKKVPMVWDPELKVVSPLSDYKDKYDFEDYDIFIIKAGKITELPPKGQAFSLFGIDKGELVHVSKSGIFQKPVFNTVVMDSVRYESFRFYGVLQKKMNQVRGIIIKKGVITGIILSEEPLDEKTFADWIKPANTSLVMLKGKNLMNEYYFVSGDKAVMRGRYFDSSGTKNIKLFINEVYLEEESKRIQVSTKGNFEMSFPIYMTPGMYEIKVVQETNTGIYTGVASIIVANSDNENKK